MENAASIVSKFGQALVEELQEIRGVGEKIVHLRDELASMNAVLRMLAEADEDCVDHLIREWTKQVRELASDAEDCVDIFKLSMARPPPQPLVDVRLNSARRLLGHAKLLPGIARDKVEKLLLKRSLAADLQALLARVVLVNERRARRRPGGTTQIGLLCRCVVGQPVCPCASPGRRPGTIHWHDGTG